MKKCVVEERVVLGTITVIWYPTLGMILEPDWLMKWQHKSVKAGVVFYTIKRRDLQVCVPIPTIKLFGNNPRAHTELTQKQSKSSHRTYTEQSKSSLRTQTAKPQRLSNFSKDKKEETETRLGMETRSQVWETRNSEWETRIQAWETKS